MLHIITRLYRFDLLQEIYESIPKEDDIRWHICKSNQREDLNYDFLSDPRVILHNINCLDTDRTAKTNFVFDQIKDGYFCLVDDDTIFHGNMYIAYTVLYKKEYIGMMIGVQLNSDGSIRLTAKIPEACSIDTGQCIAHYSALTKVKWSSANSPIRDFIFWNDVYNFFNKKCILTEIHLSWYNKFITRVLLLLYKARKEHLEVLQNIAPSWKIVSTTNLKEAKTEIINAEVVMGNHNLCEVLPFNKRLGWLQTNSVGVDKILKDSGKFIRYAAITNAKGVYTKEMCEHTVAMLLMMHRELHLIRDSQNTRKWKRSENLETLESKKVLILGYGNLGKTIGEKLKVFDMDVYGVNTKIQHFNDTHWKELLPDMDFVICALPATKETKYLLDVTELDKLSKNTIVINVGRSDSLNEKHLFKLLKSNKLRGAALDVFSEEPIPRNNPEWDIKNLFISPHTARSKETKDCFKFEKLFEDNFSEYVKTNRVCNLIDKIKGY